MLAALLLAAALAAPRCASAGKPSSKWINSFAGPWIAAVEKATMCDPGETMADNMNFFMNNARLTHFNPQKPLEPQVLNADIAIKNFAFNDTHWCRITLATRSNNQWKDNAFVMFAPHGGCSFFRANLPVLYSGVFRGAPHAPLPCVVAVGEYPVRNMSTPWTSPNIPVMPYGHYRVKIRGGEANTAHLPPTLCVMAEARIMAKVAH